jgi:hypothetical protein
MGMGFNGDSRRWIENARYSVNGVIVGQGHDLYIITNDYTSASSYSTIGYTYEFSANCADEYFFTGSMEFTESEYEVVFG